MGSRKCREPGNDGNLREHEIAGTWELNGIKGKRMKHVFQDPCSMQTSGETWQAQGDALEQEVAHRQQSRVQGDRMMDQIGFHCGQQRLINDYD